MVLIKLIDCLTVNAWNVFGSAFVFEEYSKSEILTIKHPNFFKILVISCNNVIFSSEYNLTLKKKKKKQKNEWF